MLYGSISVESTIAVDEKLTMLEEVTGRRSTKGTKMGVTTSLKRAAIVAAVCAFSALLPSVSAGELPPAQVSFSVEGQEFLGGQAVSMSGRIQPATVRETIRLETQVFRNDTWQAYDVQRTRTNSRGRFAYTHEAFPAGKRYRTRALWAETVDHLAGKTVWDSFRVQRRSR